MNLGNLSRASLKSVFRAAAAVAVLGGSAYIVSANVGGRGQDAQATAGIRGYQILTQKLPIGHTSPGGMADMVCPTGKKGIYGGLQAYGRTYAYASFPDVNSNGDTWHFVVEAVGNTAITPGPIDPVTLYLICVTATQ